MSTKKRTTQASRLAARNTKRLNTRLIAVGIFAVVLIAIIWAISSSAQKPPAANTSQYRWHAHPGWHQEVFFRAAYVDR